MRVSLLEGSVNATIRRTLALCAGRSLASTVPSIEGVPGILPPGTLEAITTGMFPATAARIPSAAPELILPPAKVQKLNKIFLKKGRQSSEKIFKLIKKQVTWLNIKYGQVLLFNQTLPHGNRINREKETRWSLNCRFKGVFTPYRDKRLGEFFEPITLRKISQLAIKYNLPKIK